MIPLSLQFKIKNYKCNVTFNFAADVDQGMYKFNNPILLPKYKKCLTLFSSLIYFKENQLNTKFSSSYDILTVLLNTQSKH
jgi:hypothetical protein